MKRLFLQKTCLALIFLGIFTNLGALEMELTGGVNFMTLHPDRTVPLSDPNTTDQVKEFSYYPMGLLNFRLSGDFNEVMAFRINLERDNILQNSLNTIFTAKTEYFNVEFGPFIGISDKFDTPDVGINGGIEVLYPGIVSLSLTGFTSLGSNLDFTSDNYREGAEARLSFWVPKMIITGSAGLRSFERTSEDQLSELKRNDTLIRYMLNVDFYSKGSPVIFSLRGGFQKYSRVYSRGITWEYTDEVKSYFGGFEIQVETSSAFRLKAGIEIPFLLKVEAPMTVTSEFLSLSKFTAGFVVSLDNRYE